LAVIRGGEPGGVQANIEATSGPSGEAPTGEFFLHFGGGGGPDYAGTVTCLAVSGHTAVIGFVGTFRALDIQHPVAGLIQVTDTGGPGSDQDLFEGPVAENEGPPTSPPPDCSTFPSGGASYNVFDLNPDGRPNGDIVVTDAQPSLPTSKDRCKNSGWKTYGVFKNQGDCVSFVATKGKNPPANSP
jgi:hypothetical protein